MANLQELDIMQHKLCKNDIEIKYRISGYSDLIEEFYINNRDTEEIFNIEPLKSGKNFQKIAREHLLYMGEAVDYISYLQIIERFPVTLQPSYLLRQNKKTTSYLDIFLQKNPNLFFCSGN